MGSCLSKKGRSSNGVAVVSPGTVQDFKSINNGGTTVKTMELKNGNREKEAEKELKEENSIVVKKEIFVIRHRKSHDKSSDQQQEGNPPVSPPISGDISRFRPTSCTKEEVDAILIQCGRLSRSSSERGRKYSGSKRSFDFDNSDRDALAVSAAADDGSGDRGRNNDSIENEEDESIPERRRRSPRPSPSRERRRTPSRERDQSNNGGRSRRVSRSPGRRSSEPTGNSAIDNTTLNVNNLDFNGKNGGSSRKPVKMVSVPATVSEKSNNGGDSGSATTIKRISVKRNAGDAAVRVASSPRSQSPARTITNGKVSDENSQQLHPPSLSRSSSRKEKSPYRRNALTEIDPNTINGLNQKPKVETKSKVTSTKITTMAEQTIKGEETKVQPWTTETEPLKPLALTRTRSRRRSRDLDINPETTTSYTTLLLEDIQNFHQKNTTIVSLPPCLTKACSILEAVADLNSTTRTNPPPPYRASFGSDLIGIGKGMSEGREPPLLESEVAVDDDVMEPSFQKYVTVVGGGDTADEESSGSNSFVGNRQNQGISSSYSSWDQNSADDRNSKSVNLKDEGQPSLGSLRNGSTRKESVRTKERRIPTKMV